jgi:hypothetical protein
MYAAGTPLTTVRAARSLKLRGGSWILSQGTGPGYSRESIKKAFDESSRKNKAFELRLSKEVFVMGGYALLAGWSPRPQDQDSDSTAEIMGNAQR